RRAFDLEGRAADLDEVPVAQRARPIEPLPFDPRAVEGAEILDLQPVPGGPDHRMTPRDERIVDSDVGIDSTDHELGLDPNSLPGERPFFHHQRGHSGESRWCDRSGCGAATGHGEPVILEMVSRQSSWLSFGRHLPIESLSEFHQPPTIVGARPGSVAVPSMSTWSSLPSFSCVQTRTKSLFLSRKQKNRPPRLPVGWIQGRSPAGVVPNCTTEV